jgi:hypothetical protein
MELAPYLVWFVVQDVQMGRAPMPFGGVALPMLLAKPGPGDDHEAWLKQQALLVLDTFRRSNVAAPWLQPIVDVLMVVPMPAAFMPLPEPT